MPPALILSLGIRFKASQFYSPKLLGRRTLLSFGLWKHRIQEAGDIFPLYLHRYQSKLPFRLNTSQQNPKPLKHNKPIETDSLNQEMTNSTNTGKWLCHHCNHTHWTIWPLSETRCAKCGHPRCGNCFVLTLEEVAPSEMPASRRAAGRRSA